MEGTRPPCDSRRAHPSSPTFGRCSKLGKWAEWRAKEEDQARDSPPIPASPSLWPPGHPHSISGASGLCLPPPPLWHRGLCPGPSRQAPAGSLRRKSASPTLPPFLLSVSVSFSVSLSLRAPSCYSPAGLCAGPISACISLFSLHLCLCWVSPSLSCFLLLAVPSSCFSRSLPLTPAPFLRLSLPLLPR